MDKTEWAMAFLAVIFVGFLLWGLSGTDSEPSPQPASSTSSPAIKVHHMDGAVTCYTYYDNSISCVEVVGYKR